MVSRIGYRRHAGICNMLSLLKMSPEYLYSLFGFVAFPMVLMAIKLIKNELKSAVQFIIEGVMYYFVRVFRQRVAAELTLKKYARAQLTGPTGYLPVPSRNNVKLETDRSYVPLLLENAGLRKLVDHNSVLGVGTRILIVGDPGSGKSTFIKRIFRDTCRNATSGSKNAKLPIRIELKDLDIGKTTKDERHRRCSAKEYKVYCCKKPSLQDRAGLRRFYNGERCTVSLRWPR